VAHGPAGVIVAAGPPARRADVRRVTGGMAQSLHGGALVQPLVARSLAMGLVQRRTMAAGWTSLAAVAGSAFQLPDAQHNSLRARAGALNHVASGEVEANERGGRVAQIKALHRQAVHFAHDERAGRAMAQRKGIIHRADEGDVLRPGGERKRGCSKSANDINDDSSSCLVRACIQRRSSDSCVKWGATKEPIP